MSVFINYLREVKFLLGSDTNGIIGIICLFFIISLIDLAGIGLIFPYVSIIINPQILEDNLILKNIFFDNNFSHLESINILGICLILIFIIKAIVGIYVNKEISKFSFKKSVDIRSSLMKSYQNLPYIRYTERNSSEYIHNINLADKFAGATLTPLLKLLCEGIVIIVIISFLSFQDYISLLVIMAIIVPFVFLYDRIFKPLLFVYGEKANSESKKIIKNINEGIRGLKEIRVLGKEVFFYESMREAAKNYAEISVNAEVITVIPRYVMETIIILIFVLAIFIYSFSSNNIINFIPTLSLFGIAGVRLAPAANQIIININKLRYSRNSVSLLYKDLMTLSKINLDESDSDFNKKHFEEIKLTNVSFDYSSRNEKILDQVNVNIKKGDYIGILGPSGSGKSTFINLLLGLISPSSGDIYLNGHKLTNSENYFMKFVGYLPQDVFLIDSSISKNIALGLKEEEINYDKIKECISGSKLDKLLDQLPDGLNTKIGENGLQLSGGQKQRLAIARLLYFEKEVIIMDESTSSLDTDTEKQIIDEVNSFKKEKTIISISHRLSSLSECDKFFYMKNGKIEVKKNIN